MDIPVRPVVAGLLVIGLTAAVLTKARAGGDDYFPPVKDKPTVDECGSCHMAFPPAMLPAASWRRMMVELDDHFGDNASLDPQTAAHVTRYLVDNAADAGGRRYGRKLMKGVAAGASPQRITELPKWVREHDEVSRSEWQHKDVGSKANCPACHVDANDGYFEDD
ncbi:diheme cytochrome c [Aromatoleum aromaticum]|uniref:Diheme cytochrome c n=1 Tax=Aromatoleum aromaticum (strain DSM 19018 / LMG 30748 / EbN1) TaxID=76114 RepID=Q5NXN6_AROAE|nr:diheme cytochrome c [Aromatoleum aromaticum]NMG54527.1 cytochrome C [Aromatoleum aromaticum]CAI10178.1 Diheme cytochrome c [Aromatoleum aromaticum EbN1]